MLADRVDDLRRTLSDVADPDRAPQMAAYMKDRFPFLGVPSPRRRTASKGFVAAGRGLAAAELLDAADACWAEPEREFQYVGVDLLVRWVRDPAAVRTFVSDRAERLSGLTRREALKHIGA